MAICKICGKEYVPYRSKQITCGDRECQRQHHKEYIRIYNKKKRKEKNAYNRQWMAERRKKRKEEAAKVSKADGICANCYWRDWDELGLADVCVNADSEHCADYVSLSDSCDAWEKER